MNVDWLNGTWHVTQGQALMICGIALVFFLILALILELRTKKIYYNHDKRSRKSRKKGDTGENGLLGDLLDWDDDDDEDGDDSDALGDLIRGARAELDDWDPDDEPDHYDFDDELEDDKPKKRSAKK